MPLAFDSISHGQVAFGFFNIESDMILLNRYFLWAEHFCHSISEIAEKRQNYADAISWEVYTVKRNEDVGNLMGAIDGTDHRGFIGEVYKLFPFPQRQADFKQKPDGFKTRPTIEGLIQKYATKTNIPFIIDENGDRMSIGEYVFNRASFLELIRYVWLGGYPRWKGAVGPDYVLAMKRRIEKSKNPIFVGLLLDD